MNLGSKVLQIARFYFLSSVCTTATHVILLFLLMHLACACLPDGSDSSLCDSSTGQCSCLPGVNGQRCEQCMVGNTEPTELKSQRCVVTYLPGVPPPSLFFLFFPPSPSSLHSLLPSSFLLSPSSFLLPPSSSLLPPPSPHTAWVLELHSRSGL